MPNFMVDAIFDAMEVTVTGGSNKVKTDLVIFHEYHKIGKAGPVGVMDKPTFVAKAKQQPKVGLIFRTDDKDSFWTQVYARMTGDGGKGSTSKA